MTAAEKKRFIRDLIATVQKDVLAKVPAMPEEWDGHELRQYVADKFDGATSHLIFRGGRRKRDYENEVLVRNL
jgi:hypothetical protein